MALADLLNQASTGVNPLAFLAGLGGGQQQQLPPAQTGVPQAAPIDPTGASVLAPAAPGNVLARLQTGAPTPPAPTVPHIFSGAPDVRGMSRGAAFASGVSGGLADASKQALLAQQMQSQQFQNNLELYKTLWGQKNTEASQAEQAKRDQTLAGYYAAQTDPELQGKLAKAKAEAAEPDEQANAAERQKILGDIEKAQGVESGSLIKDPGWAQFVAKGDFPTKAPGGAALNPTEEKGVLSSSNKIDALQSSLNMLKQAKGVLDAGEIYTGLEAKAATAAANNLPNSMAGMAFDLDKAARTTTYDNLVRNAVLPGGKELFGRVTNYEERVMQNLTPTSGNSPQAMRMVLESAIQRREGALAGEYQTIDDIKSRRMFQPGYRAPDPYASWDVEKDLAPVNKSAPRSSGQAPTKTPIAAPGAAGAAPLGNAADVVSSANAAPARVHVSSPEDLAKYPPGTPFITDDGKTGTRK